MKTNTNNARGGAFASKKLLAAFAVLAVAFVVLAALPAVVTDSDAADDAAPSYKEGVIAAGYAKDAKLVAEMVNSITGGNLSVDEVADSTVFMVFHVDEGKYNKVEYSRSVNGTEVTSPAASSQEKTSGTFGANTVYYMFTVQSGIDTTDNADCIDADWSKDNTYTLTVKLTGPDNASKTITADVKGETVTLYQDVVSAVSAPLIIKGDVVLNLNDNKLTINNSSTTANRTITVDEDASLKIVGRDKEASILEINAKVDNYNSIIGVSTNASVTMEKVSYTATGTAFFPAANASSVTIIDSDVKAPVYIVGTNNELLNHDGTGVEIKISGSTLTGIKENGATPVYINAKGIKLSISDSTIIGQRHAVMVVAGEATIENSNLVSDNKGSDPATWTQGNNVTPGTLFVGNSFNNDSYNGEAIVKVSGGVIIAKSGAAVSTEQYNSKAGKTTVNLTIGDGIDTKITCGDGDSAESIIVSGLRYVANESTTSEPSLKIETGSVELSGALDEITIVSGKATVSDDLSVNAGLVLEDGAEVSVAEGKKITIADGAEFTVENGAGLYLGKGASIVKKNATGPDTPVYIPGSTIVFGTTEYTVFTYTFDGIYTLYYGLANQPVVFDGAEVDPKDIVASVRSLYCVDDAGVAVDARMSLTGDCTFYDDAIGAVYPGSYSYVEIKVKVDIDDGTDYASYSLFAKTNLVIAKAPMADADCSVEEGLVYDGEVKDPETSVSFMDELLPADSYRVEYFSDAACTVSVEVKHAGKYYAKFTATDSNPYFTGSKVVEFQVGKSADRALDVEVDPVMAGKNYVWNAGAYRSNIHVALKDASAAYTVDYGAGAGYVDAPRFGTLGVAFTDQASFDAIIDGIDSTQTAEYTLFLRFNTTGAVDFEDVSMMIVKIYVGPMGYTITVDDTIVGGTIVAPASAIAGDEVELTITPDEKFRIGTVSYTLAGTTTPVTITGGKFIMPAGNIVVTSTFVRMYEVDFDEDTTIVKAGDRAFAPGEIVEKNTVLSISAPTGYRIVSATYEVDGEDVAIEDLDRFLMPELDIYITVVTEVDLRIIFVEEGYRDIVFDIDSEGDFFYLPSPANHDRWVLTVGEDKRFYNPMSGYVPVLEDADDAGRIVFNAVDIEDEEEVVTVTFVYGLEEEIEYAFDVVKGGSIGIFPAAAYVDGYIVSWKCLGEVVDESTVADSDMIIIASYEEIPVTEVAEITFVYGDETYTIYVVKGESIGIFPAAAYVDGKILSWTCDGVSVNEDTIADGDMTIIASYTDAPVVDETVRVTFTYGVGPDEYYSSVLDVKKDSYVEAFPDASVEGYTYVWKIGDRDVTDGFLAKENTEVTAVYTAIEPVVPTTGDVVFVFGSTVKTVTLPLGALVVPESVATAATKEGYTLAWFCNGAAITADTQVVDGMVVVAQYTEIPVEPEYSEIMTVALVFSNGKIYYTIVAADGKIIPAGKLTIEYSYLDDSGKYLVYRLVEEVITVENVDGITIFGTIEPTVDIYSYSASFAFGDKTIGSPTYFVEVSA